MTTFGAGGGNYNLHQNITGDYYLKQQQAAPPPPAPITIINIQPVTPTFDPKIEANALYGKPMALCALGFARIGASPAPIVGPYINNGVVDFIVSFGVPANPSGDRKIYKIYLDNECAWSSVGGGTLPAHGTFASEAFDFVFKPGTLTQTVCSLETTHFSGDENAYRPQMLLQITGLPYARFMANTGKPVPYVACDIGDVTDGADPLDGLNLGEALERVAYSPWANYTSSSFEAAGVTDVVDAILIKGDFTVIQLCQNVVGEYRNLDLVMSDKVRVQGRGSNVEPDFIFDRNSIIGGDQAITVVRGSATRERREHELIAIDPDQDYTAVPSLAKIPRDPIVISAAVGKATVTIPLVIDADTRQALATFSQNYQENARRRVAFNVGVSGYGIEPGDLFALVDIADGFDNEVFKCTQTSHLANWIVEVEGEAILRCSIFSIEVDPDFAFVVLLLHFNGIDGQTSAIDFSSYAHSISFSAFGGGASIDTASSLFGGGSLLCPAASGAGVSTPVASAPEFSISPTNTSPYTIELWAKFNNINRDQVLIARHTGISGLHFMLRQNSDDELQWLTSSDTIAYGTTLATTAANITAGQAYRIAVDKDSTGKVRIYVDGVMKASDTPADSVIHGGGNDPVSVGIDGLGGRPFDGWIDEVRVTVGISRYGDDVGDAGYTPATAAFPNE